jgi:hypothetical protein
MCRRLIRSLLLATAVAMLVLPGAAAGLTDLSATRPLLERFLALGDPDPNDFRALRHLEAANEQFDSRAWMDVWTEADRYGFRYEVVGEGGSDYIRSKVFRVALDTERRMWGDGGFNAAAVTPTNYMFRDGAMHADGLASLLVKARRKDMMLVDGAIFLNPADGDLVRVEGRLAKTPSFWTRRVDIVRRFRRFGAVRLPVSLDAVASVLIAGRSTFNVSYDYERVNGERVGSPQPRLAFNAASAR